MTDHITEYSDRSLTYEKDTLDAFRGILLRGPFNSFFGILVMPNKHHISISSDAGFATGLWWTPALVQRPEKHTRLQRRPHFPSWTWIGWKGSVTYPFATGIHQQHAEDAEDEYMAVRPQRFRTRFWLQDAAETPRSLDTAIFAAEYESMMLPETLYSLVVDADVFRLRFQRAAGPRHDVCLCICHPQAEHGGVVSEAERWEDVVFFERFEGESAEYRDRLGRVWDCVLLFESTRGYQCLMVIEWQGDTTYRVGNLQMQDHLAVALSDLPSTRKRIKIM
jgi:hypothetical protein